MTRHGDWLDANARALASETGLNYTRIRKVLGRSARDKTGRIVPEDSDADPEAAGMHFWPDLRAGIPYLGPERTLQLFEEVGADQLGRRILTVDQWSRSASPLYRLSDLTAHITALRTHLLRNRSDILRTGYTGEVLTESPWLWERQSNLYPVKQPYCAEIVVEADGPVKVYYTWTKEPWTVMLNSSGQLTIFRPEKGPSDPGPIEYCDYSAAPTLDGLSAVTIACVEALRPRVLDFKLEALQLLGRAARGQSKEDGIELCLGLLKRSFLPEETKLLLQVDMIFFQLEQRDARERVETVSKGAGGIAEIIALALDLEGCLRTHAVEDLRDLLEEHALISKEPFSDPRPVFESYFEVVDKPFRSIVDGAIAAFLKACEAVAPHFGEALNRVQREMPVDIISRDTTWGTEASEFASLLSGFAEFQKRLKAANGHYMAANSNGEGKRDASVPTRARTGSVQKPPPRTRLKDLSLNLTGDGLVARAGSWSETYLWADLLPEGGPGRPATMQRTALRHFARNGGRLRADDVDLPGKWNRFNIRAYICKVRGWLKTILGLSDDPIVWDPDAKAYVLRIDIAEDGLPRFPTPNGATWAAVALEELEDKRIEVTVEGLKPSAGQSRERQDDGRDRIVNRATVRPETLTRQYTLEELGLTGKYGRQALGNALSDLLRAKGRSEEDEDGITMPELNSYLQEFLNIGGEAFDVNRGAKGTYMWVAKFRASSRVHHG